MSSKDELTCNCIDHDTARLMRDGAQMVTVGWWMLDDNNRAQVGPFDTCEECEAELKRLQAE